MATNVPQTGAPSLSIVPNSSVPNPLYGVTLATVILCCSLTTIFTAARLVTKYLTAKFGVEDYLLLAAWLMNIIFVFLLLGAVHAGLGHHLWDVQVAVYVQLAKFSWALELIYTPGLWLAKASLIFQLIRIFTPTKSGAVYWACHALIWANLAFYTAVFFTVLFECHPIHATWDPLLATDCVNRNLIVVITAAINVFSDVLIILMPIWAIWHLHMAPKRKLGASAVFATGLLACASSICRLIYSIRTLSSLDFSYITAQVGLWAAAEFSAIILCACFPMMPRLARYISESRSKSGSNSSTRNLRKTERFGGSENQKSGNVSRSRLGDEELLALDGRSESAQQSWNPIKREEG